MRRFHQTEHPVGDDMSLLDTLAQNLVQDQFKQWGYPFNHALNFGAYHDWIARTGLGEVTLVNVGDPWKTDWDMLSTDVIERKVIEFWAHQYGFKPGEAWGIVTNGGTDGNMHGVYFGRKILEGKTGIPPILYVSEETHYSVQKLGDIQNIETRTIKALPAGQMDVADLAQKMDSSRPALIAIAIGGTFKGAMDNQKAIEDVIQQVKPIAVYRHVDMALFGGYFPFLDDPIPKSILNIEEMHYDSLAVSGHKFMSINEPCGVFICKRDTMLHVDSQAIPYLNGAKIPTVSCSRNGFSPLKMFWRIATSGEEGFKQQALHVMKMTAYLQQQLNAHGIFTLVNPYSNTVCFSRPRPEIIHKYALACGHSDVYGDLSHVVVMQYFTKELIDNFIRELFSKN